LSLSDTHDHAMDVLIEGYRHMTPAQKFRRVSELNRSIQQLALARIREQYGKISDRELKLRLASLWLDRETMIKAFSWDPEKEGY